MTFLSFDITFILIAYFIAQTSSKIDFDAKEIKSVVNDRGSNAFTFVASYFYGDGVTICNACSECSFSKLTNLFTNDGDYCIECQGDARCYSEIISVKVDFDFDVAWSIKYHKIKSSTYSDIHDPVEFSLLASSNKHVWEELSTTTEAMYPQGRNEDKMYPLYNEKLFKYYRIIFKKKKGIDSGNAPIRIGTYDLASFYTTQVTNEIMFDLFGAKSSYSAASEGFGDTTNTGFYWPVRKIIEKVENGHCVKYEGSNDGYQTRIKLEKAQTITECRGYCLEYYHRPSTKRQQFSGCQYDTKTTNCFAYDDPNYRVVHGMANASSDEQLCMTFRARVFHSFHRGVCADVNGSTEGNVNRLTLKENETISVEECLSLCIEAFYHSTNNGDVSGCEYDSINNGHHCYFYHSRLFVAYQGDGNMNGTCWTTKSDLIYDAYEVPSIIDNSAAINADSYVDYVTSEPSTSPSESFRRNLADQINFLDAQGRIEISTLIEENFGVTNSSSTSIENAINATEDYYADLSAFVKQDKSDPLRCKCVNCEEDMVCGGLWKGDKYENTANFDLRISKIHIVISHCKAALDWVEHFIQGYYIGSIHVITKCGESMSNIKAPRMATIEVLPNIGRCDHTYAYYIANVVPNIVQEDEKNDSIIVFLKDDISAKNLHQSGERNNFEGLLRLASSDNGFACGVLPGDVAFGQHKFLLSTYHEVETLFDFSMTGYSRNIKAYALDASEFISPYNTMGAWWRSLNVDIPSKLVQVCYGGVFAASVSNINRRDNSVWKAVEKSLSRGNNIQEGHYAERSWAALLSTPLQPYQIEALLYKSDGVYLNKSSMHGALMTRPQLLLHVGIFGTSSSELLAKSLIDYKSLLKLDGYNIAVHGKYDDGIHGFPNIDRLASCMWSKMTKSMIPDHQIEETICPNNLLLELSNYMARTHRESHDLVISNPLLTRPGTAESLGISIDPLWDVITVIYYRRYFEWITIMFQYWRKEFLEHPSLHTTTLSSFRYIDFLRKHNKRLFYGKDIKDDPVRDLSLNTQDDIIDIKKRRQLKICADQFDQTSNSDLKELTDLREYTYFVAKQYNAVARLRHVTILNLHDIRGPEMNFFCHVLDHAHNSCKAAVDKKEAVVNEHVQMKRKDFIQKKNTVIPFELETALEDIVIAAVAVCRLQANDIHTENIRSDQIGLWVAMLRSALNERNVTVEDLPFECLYDFETRLLLQVSLAYEQSMLPIFFASSKGERYLKETFSEWRFCSVDASEIIQDPQWNFLFELSGNFSLPPLPIFTLEPKTGSTSLQDTMAMNRSV